MDREGLLAELRRLVGDAGLVETERSRAAYECDGFTLERSVPDLVVLPETPAQTAAVLGILFRAGVQIVPRGAGTSLAGGCLAPPGSVVVGTSRLTAIEEIDGVNRQALVQAGVANLDLSQAAYPHGLHYAPDPSSQQVSTIGGNIANNSGGPHTLKLGVTANHLLAVELATLEGECVWLGSRAPSKGGPDLVGLTAGSEGTFGIVTRAWVRLVAPPAAVRTAVALFDGMEPAGRAVSAIVASGVIPAAVEMMDARILSALRDAFHMEFPENARALLLVEVDGVPGGLDEEAETVIGSCRSAGALEIREATDPRERRRLWSARKRAFGALGRVARNFCTQDGVVPRTRLPEMLKRVEEISNRYRIPVANVFHAGDGNLHPILLYDERDEDEVERVLSASVEILDSCLELGGCLTGEHGIGVEKIGLMERAFDPPSLAAMDTVRITFDPERRLNPHKVIPVGGGCADPTGWQPRHSLARVKPGRQAPQ